jgi:hypothetical protein
VVVLAVSALILGGGLFLQPSIDTRHFAAEGIMEQTDDDDDDDLGDGRQSCHSLSGLTPAARPGAGPIIQGILPSSCADNAGGAGRVVSAGFPISWFYRIFISIN